MPDPDDIPYVRQVKQLKDADAIRDVPVIGNLLGTANAIVDFTESDCHPDWYVYAETLFPALGEAVLVLVDFGLDDVLRGYFRPAGGRGFGGLGRASRRTRRLTKAQRARGLLRGGIPEIGELLGKNVPGAQVVKARNVGSTERFLWKVDGLAQRGLWWWMVADVAEDFTINWTSAIMQSEECSGQSVGGAVYEDLFVALGTNVNLGTYRLDTELDKWGVANSNGLTFNAPAGFSGGLTSWGTLRPRFLSIPATGRIGIRKGTQGTAVKWADPLPPVDADWPLEQTVHVPVEGGVNYQLVYQTSGFQMELVDGGAVFTVAGGPA